MAGFIPNATYTFLDDAGEPLALGSVYTYEVGTTTNKATYPTIADAIAGTNANSNPVATDSAGRATIVLAGPTKLVVKDSDGNTVWTKDNVSNDNTVLDTNGNEVLDYGTTADAVNYVVIKNSATGNPALIDTAGDDATPNLKIQADAGAGTVTVVGLSATTATLQDPTIDNATITNTTFAPTTPFIVAGTSSGPAEIQLKEDTDNGTNYTGFASPAALAANVIYTLPSADGAANTTFVTDGSKTLSFSTLTMVAATQAQQEAGSSAVVPVVPSVQHYHPSAAKCWALADYAGNVFASYNLTSVTDTGTGTITFTIATDFSSSTYAISLTVQGSLDNVVRANSQAAGTLSAVAFRTITGSPADPTAYFFTAFGDQ